MMEHFVPETFHDCFPGGFEEEDFAFEEEESVLGLRLDDEISTVSARCLASRMEVQLQ